MRWFMCKVCTVFTVVAALGYTSGAMGAGKLTLKELEQRAARFNVCVALPRFETTPAAVTGAISNAIAEAEAALARIAAQPLDKLSFATTVGALDDAMWRAGQVANRVVLIRETSPEPAVRDAATEAIKVFQDWAVGLDYREDVYRVIKAYADSRPALEGEDAKLLKETLRDYRRAGLHLPEPERKQVETLRKELARLCTDFERNVTLAEKTLVFSRAELDGVPEDFLNLPEIKTGPDQYTIKVNVTWQYLTVMENAHNEATRKRVLIAHHNLAREQNIPLLERILALRDAIAKKLGYPTWADYQLEVKMARTAARAIEFETNLVAALDPKFRAELEQMRALKVQDTGNADAKIQLWDWRYYANRLKKQNYNVDPESLKVYFPLERTLHGMFGVFEKIFHVRFEQVEPEYKWVDELQLWAVFDAESGMPLGLFYLDLFPRPGKYNHFAVFDLISGKQLPDGRYHRPVAAMVCNFPPPQPDRPSLLKHSDVETIFHEFGHVMHQVLTRAKYSRFAGTSVPRDFVEAPSQMLENWVWDKSVLDTFAADYRDPVKKIPGEILNQLRAARFATEATRYRRQLAFGLMDLMLHTRITEANAHETLALANKILSEIFLPVPEDTALPAYFGHLVGYDAAYYSYAWADVIASDMATCFESSPQGYFDPALGKRLRTEIYEPGDSRDVNISIIRFLGREYNIEPFLKKIGAVTTRP